jgi:predicted DsbA family dithiol-disulfide isomerase
METKNDNNSIIVEIWSDVVCPFCYIGKRRLERAMQQFPYRDQVEVIWRSYQLDPFAVTHPNKTTLQMMVEEKGLPSNRINDYIGYINEMAKEVGLDYHLDKTLVVNSFKAHRLLHLAKKYNKQNELEESLFAAYFTQGQNIDDEETLLRIAISIGFEEKETKEVLYSDAYSDEVKHDIAHAKQLGISGVPYFLFDDKYAISGAQNVEIFMQALNRAFADHQKPEIIEFSSNNPGVCGPDGCSL